MVVMREVKSVNGWYRDRDGAFRAYDPDVIAKAKAALDADIAKCGCDPRAFAPSHATVSQDGSFTYHCRSWSRWYNPATEKMEGNAHCTCDGCF